MTKSILEEAQEIIYGDREKTYGSPDKNLKAIAALWNAHLQNRYNIPVTLDAEDVCIMMALLKIARLENDTTHRDSKVDIAGYIALLDRIQQPKDAESPAHKSVKSFELEKPEPLILLTTADDLKTLYRKDPDPKQYIVLAFFEKDGSVTEREYYFSPDQLRKETVNNWKADGFTHFRFE